MLQAAWYQQKTSDGITSIDKFGNEHSYVAFP